MEMTRKSFLAGAGMGAAAMAMASVVPALADDASAIEWAAEADIVVLGSGSGGGPASVHAADLGNSVILVEKADWLGGTMRRCGGAIAAANTCVQKALGVEDDVDAFYNYVVDCGMGIVNKGLLRTFVDRATADFDWYVLDLAGQTEADWHFVAGIGEDPENGVEGIESHPDGERGLNVCMRPGLNLGTTPVYFEEYGYEPVPRCYWFEPDPDDFDVDATRMYNTPSLVGHPLRDKGRGGTGLYKPCEDAINARDAIDVHMSTMFESFVINAEGEVIGVRCIDLSTGEHVFFKANKGVLLATGDWQNNPQMLFDYTLFGFGGQNLNDWDDPSKTSISPITSWENRYEGHAEGMLAAMALGAKSMVMAAGPWRGGLVTDEHAQLLNTLDQPIPRLYASSYAVGGKMGPIYAHCGLHNMWNISMGMEAVEQITALEPVADDAPIAIAATAESQGVAAEEAERLMSGFYDNPFDEFEVKDLKDGVYTGSAWGVNEVTVTLEVKDGVISVVGIDHNETMYFGGREAIDDGTAAAQIEAAQGYEIDGLTGASLTTRAVRAATARALAQAVA